MSLFEPKAILQTYTDFRPSEYKSLGYKAVFVDIDNTIAIPHTGVCDEKAEAFLNEIKNAGLKVVIFSNASEKRVLRFIRNIRLDYTYLSFKPFPFRLIRKCKQLGIKTKEAVVIGDQLITDVLCANLAGSCAIYSKQLQEKDTFITSINRRTERFIWRHILHEKV